MAALAQSSAQTRFIVGVPLGNNKPDVVKGMISRSEGRLGSALIGIELGNEPIYWRCPGLVSSLEYYGFAIGGVRVVLNRA
jgi:hypothetical protein